MKMSTRLKLGELKVDDSFIVWPEDGDDHGHGGFRGSMNIFRKTKKTRTVLNVLNKDGTRSDFVLVECKNAKHGTVSELPATMEVIQVNL